MRDTPPVSCWSRWRESVLHGTQPTNGRQSAAPSTTRPTTVSRFVRLAPTSVSCCSHVAHHSPGMTCTSIPCTNGIRASWSSGWTNPGGCHHTRIHTVTPCPACRKPPKRRETPPRSHVARCIRHNPDALLTPESTSALAWREKPVKILTRRLRRLPPNFCSPLKTGKLRTACRQCTNIACR